MLACNTIETIFPAPAPLFAGTKMTAAAVRWRGRPSCEPVLPEIHWCSDNWCRMCCWQRCDDGERRAIHTPWTKKLSVPPSAPAPAPQCWFQPTTASAMVSVQFSRVEV